jgi:hypothetical protein
MPLRENAETLDEDEESRLLALETLSNVTYAGKTFKVYSEKIISGSRTFISVSVIGAPKEGTYDPYIDLGCFYDLTQRCFYPLRSSNLPAFRAFLRDYQPLA